MWPQTDKEAGSDTANPANWQTDRDKDSNLSGNLLSLCQFNFPSHFIFTFFHVDIILELSKVDCNCDSRPVSNNRHVSNIYKTPQKYHQKLNLKHTCMTLFF